MKKNKISSILQGRTAGVLLHISSLPGLHGIGSLGAEATSFVDWLHEANLTFWQILPLVFPDSANSPYSSGSAFSGNPLLIDLHLLKEDGFLSEEELTSPPLFPTTHTDFAAVKKYKLPLLCKAAERFLSNCTKAWQEKFDEFCKKNTEWLDDAVLFFVLERANYGKPWWDWESQIRNRNPKALAAFRKKHAKELEIEKVIQFFFYTQWHHLKTYANGKGIYIIGDIPIYVGVNSVDMWANPNLFKVDKNRRPTFVSGVPPDAFTAKGQFWGNPVYNWNEHEKTGFAWWISRIKHNFSQADVVRIDHFRGLAAYWEIPATAEDARSGKWVPGPGHKFMKAIKKACPDMALLAEDLGYIDEDVRTLRDTYELPGMLVLQFAFGSDAKSEYLPHNFSKNKFVYSGTHDNETLHGWWENLTANARIHVCKYLGKPAASDREIVWAIINLAFLSVANHAIIPMQDFLCLDNKGRMNIPGSDTPVNWAWRLEPGARGDYLTLKIKELVSLSNRKA